MESKCLYIEGTIFFPISKSCLCQLKIPYYDDYLQENTCCKKRKASIPYFMKYLLARNESMDELKWLKWFWSKYGLANI